jgi:hypothetical protein
MELNFQGQFEVFLADPYSTYLPWFMPSIAVCFDILGK